MKQWKRLAAVILSAALVLLLMAACGPSSNPGSGSTPSSSSGSTEPGKDPSSSEKPADSDPSSSESSSESTADSDPEQEENAEWKASRTMAYFTKLGITPENVSFEASYKAEKDGETNYVSYQARGDKAVLSCYYRDEDGLQLYQKICKYGSKYYLGIDDGEGGIEWHDADSILANEFESVRKICKIPTSTEPAVGYQTVDANTEIVSLSSMPYRFTLDASGVPATVKTFYNGERYEATFSKLQPCPANVTFEKPIVND